MQIIEQISVLFICIMMLMAAYGFICFLFELAAFLWLEGVNVAGKIIAYVRTDIVGSKIECEYDIPQNWENLNEDEREMYLEDVAQEHAANNSEYGAYVKEK